LKGATVALFISLLLANAGCAPPSQEHALWTEIPSIFIVCQTATCRQNVTPTIYGVLTTSGCTDSTPGLSRSTTTTSITCSAGVGCVGTLWPWLYTDGRVTTGIPRGAYSVCVRIDYNSNYPSSTTGDTITSKQIEITSTSSTTVQIYNDWTDQ
jgi:hypothetical protein